MSLAEHVIAVVTKDTERVALVRRSFAQIAVALRVVHVEEAESAMHFSPATAGAAAEALVPHLIVLDDWPSTHSRHALKEIRADDTLADVRVVVLCSTDGETDVAQAYAMGANSCLTVSADPDEFVEVMKAAGRYWLLLNRWPTW
ncbi:MAG: hypothetical protein OEN20_01535 [Gammaproteobacteria bacterium]|nr:hypothetical protein [Gammaproteobacteria bacterium]